MRSGDRGSSGNGALLSALSRPAAGKTGTASGAPGRPGYVRVSRPSHSWRGEAVGRRHRCEGDRDPHDRRPGARWRSRSSQPAGGKSAQPSAPFPRESRSPSASSPRRYSHLGLHRLFNLGCAASRALPSRKSTLRISTGRRAGSGGQGSRKRSPLEHAPLRWPARPCSSAGSRRKPRGAGSGADRSSPERRAGSFTATCSWTRRAPCAAGWAVELVLLEVLRLPGLSGPGW